MKFAILKNETDDTLINWEIACRKNSIAYEIIDLTRADWLSHFESDNFNMLLACPPGRESLFKQLYDERIFILEKELGYFIYPSQKEISIHENKRFLSFWLEAHRIRHPQTWVFYDKNEALNFAKASKLPLVGKFNIGSSGKGVKVLMRRKELTDYIEAAFSEGLRQNWGPNLKMGGYIERLLKIIKNPARIINRIRVYQKVYHELQKGFVILQEYIPHDFEWRVVKIGNSYFGHQKVKQGDKASGTKGIKYVPPPMDLLNYVDRICSQHNLNSMAIDLFENGDSEYLINEMQCIFGHVQQYICSVHGKPGRFRLKNGEWIFEEGLFNSNLSFDLRLENALAIAKTRINP